MGERLFEELADAVGLARRDDEIVGLILLEHLPHGLDILGGVAPVALGVEIAEERAFSCEAGFDAGQWRG